MLYQHAAEAIGEVSGVVAQPSDVNYTLATLFSYVFFLGLFVLFAGDWFFSNVYPHPGARALVAKVRENQMAALGVLMLCNFLAGSLMQTGAFEVYYNGDLVFSKLQTGSLPDVNYLVSEITRRGIGAPGSALPRGITE